MNNYAYTHKHKYDQVHDYTLRREAAILDWYSQGHIQDIGKREEGSRNPGYFARMLWRSGDIFRNNFTALRKISHSFSALRSTQAHIHNTLTLRLLNVCRSGWGSQMYGYIDTLQRCRKGALKGEGPTVLAMSLHLRSSHIGHKPSHKYREWSRHYLGYPR